MKREVEVINSIIKYDHDCSLRSFEKIKLIEEEYNKKLEKLEKEFENKKKKLERKYTLSEKKKEDIISKVDNYWKDKLEEDKKTISNNFNKKKKVVIGMIIDNYFEKLKNV